MKFIQLAFAFAALTASTDAQTLKLLIWEEYLDPAVVKAFTKETGIKVVEDNFDTNESMMAKAGTGRSGYDIVAPSDYAVQIMARRGLLAKLDRKKVPNLSNVAADFAGLYYDTKQEYAVPYTWGTSGLAYNKKKVPQPPAKWADLFDTEKLKPWKGRISMLDDGREAASAALLALGLNPNTKNAGEIGKAGELLIKQKPFVAKYDSSAFEDSLASGETWLAHGYSGDIAVAQSENPDLAYLIPEEGAVFFVDNLAILKESKRSDAAHKFLDYLMRPEVSAKNVNAMRYGSCNGKIAEDAIDEDIRKSAAFVLPPKNKRIMLEDPGQEIGDAFEQMWSKVKG